MFIRKYWIPLSVFIVAICGVGLYYLQTQPPKEPTVIYKPVEPIEKPTAEVPEGDTSQGGHVHTDGTLPDQPHETPVEQPLTVEPSSSYTGILTVEKYKTLLTEEYKRAKRSRNGYLKKLPELPQRENFQNDTDYESALLVYRDLMRVEAGNVAKISNAERRRSDE